ncbi:alpha/beta hydrolase [Naasia sp. SYSU D00057]|uniref:alpha/beta hydrolase n=1 Tax=Naasia sp. SYSU D00057 TaxID=2817380 RepID=UPI001B309C15|nr:alpha/beta hydrolase [Naasia sp. SYSU D00057]
MLGLTALALVLAAAVGPGVAPIAAAPEVIAAPAGLSSHGPFGGPVLDTSVAASVRPEQLLRGVGDLAPSDLRRFVAENPSAIRELIAEPPASQEVASWWAGLSSRDREELARDAPELIGNLDGVPYDVRDRANRAHLGDVEDGLREQLTSGVGKGAAGAIVERLRMLEKIDASLETTDGGPARSLIMLDTVMPGRAAVALGDLETADYVSFLVPGALLSVREHMTEWTKVTADIYDEQLAWGERFGDDSTVATVSWIGYRTPDVTNVAGLELAEEGASFMSGTVNGLKTLRKADEPYISVFAHSYGATAVMLALDRGDMSVDALAMIGSPGGVADSADELAVPEGRVWVGEAAWDPVVDTAFFGVDPGSPEFGAKPMSVSGSVDPMTGALLTASVGHDWYLEPGTESLRNLSLIGIDRGDWVTDGSSGDSQKTLALGADADTATR